MKYILIILLVLLTACEFEGDANTNDADFSREIYLVKRCDDTKVILHYDSYEINTTQKEICDSYRGD